MRYEFVKVQTVGKGLLSNKTSAHRDIIQDYAAKGYRYVGWFPTSSSNLLSGVIEEIDLIFEVPEE